MTAKLAPLSVTHHKIAATLNVKLSGFTAEQVTALSLDEAWWICVKHPHHPVMAKVRNRVRSGCRMCSGQQIGVGFNDLATTHPEIAATLNAELSGFTGQQVTAGLGCNAWWICGEHPNNPFRATVMTRVKGGGCGMCSGHQLGVGFNDLATTHPSLAATLNTDLSGFTAQEVTAGSRNAAWWTCDRHPDHPYKALVVTQSHGGGCGMCDGFQLGVGFNDLGTIRPDIAATLDTERSGFSASEVLSGSTRQGWWRCHLNPEHPVFAATVKVRKKGSSCTVCFRRAVTPGLNDLATTHPEIAATLNVGLSGFTALEVRAGSDRTAWWDCDEHPEQPFAAQVNSRTRQLGCSICSGKQMVVGFNDLATLRPDLVAMLDVARSGFTATEVSARSHKQSWWTCPNHRTDPYRSTVVERVNGSQCGICRGSQVLAGFNDLATTRPDVAVTLDERLSGFAATEVTAGASRDAWWTCSAHPEHPPFQTEVAYRCAGADCSCRHENLTARRLLLIVQHIVDALDCGADVRPMDVLGLGLLGRLAPTHPVMTALRVPDAKTRAEQLQEWVDGQSATGDDGTAETEPAQAPSEAPTDLNETTEDDASTEVTDDVDDLTSTPRTKRPASATDAVNRVKRQMQLGELVGMGDEDAIEFYVARAVDDMCRDAITLSSNEQALDELEEQLVTMCDGQAAAEFLAIVRDRALDLIRAARTLTMPADWSFTPAGPGTPVVQPNLMQRLVADRVRRQQFSGNWSGTGAGKTVSAVLAANLVGAGIDGLNLVVCPNNTVNGWRDTIINCFPDSRVITKPVRSDGRFELTWAAGSGARWLILNYEVPSTDEGHMAALLADNQVDFLVIDEVHWAKHRGDASRANMLSRRRRVLEAVRAQVVIDNPTCRVLALSATPVVNDLTEALSMIQLVEGSHVDLPTTITLANMFAMYARLSKVGFRWMPEYIDDLDPVAVRRVDATHLWDDYREPGANLDAINVAASMPILVEEALAAKARGAGALIYTEYKQGIIEPIRTAMQAAGLTVAEFTGDDKASIADLRRDGVDVLIGTSAIGTGVDGLQHWADTVLFACLPWTHAMYLQVIGRVHRQGRVLDAEGRIRTRVVIAMPEVDVTLPDGTDEVWSFARLRLNRIRHKETLADAVVDGQLPSQKLASPKQTRDYGERWIRRLIEAGAVASHTHPATEHTPVKAAA